MSAFQVFIIVVALVIAGEAAALAVGMHIIQKSRSAWISLKNDLLLALDVVTGLALILLAADRGNFPQPIWFPLFTILGLVTHIFRVWEYLAARASPFCGNRPLFVLNILKFVGLVLILVWGFLLS